MVLLKTYCIAGNKSNVTFLNVHCFSLLGKLQKVFPPPFREDWVGQNRFFFQKQFFWLYGCQLIFS